jgi:RNA polymerase sigma-54 factor
MGRMEFSMQPRMEQRLKMAPQIIQSIEILQLPMLALLERIQQEQLENPLLELEDTPEPDEELSPSPAKPEAAEAKDEFTRVEAINEDYHDYFSQAATRRNYGERDEKMEAIQNTPGPLPSLRDHLTEQIRFLNMTPRQRQLCEAIINNVDRDGRLVCGIAEIAESLDEPAPAAEVQEELETVQRLDPAGVAARDLKECLLLQMDSHDTDYELQRMIVMNHLPDIEAGRFPKIAKETGADIEAVKRAVAAICMLHPAPGRLYDNEVVPTITPDARVDKVDERYEVRLEDSSLPTLRISRQYQDMLAEKDSDPETHGFLQKKMESARWLIDAIQQRRETLLKVSTALVESQRAFFDEGEAHLKPLKMQEIADRVGVHVATVSRAIRQKYMQTPRGMFAMKFFFTGGTASSNGEMQTWDAVRQKISKLVAEEDKSNPLSDDEIVKRLGTEGTHIARRTVTKYRKALRIPSSRQRRSY